MMACMDGGDKQIYGIQVYEKSLFNGTLVTKHKIVWYKVIHSHYNNTSSIPVQYVETWLGGQKILVYELAS